MKVSIVTATWNSGKTVEDTIKSVLCQTYKNYEYFIIDGLSKDSTLEIARKYEPLFEGRMKIYSEKDKGIYDAMNKGFQKATGDVLMLINSDDLFARPDAVELVVKEFERHPDVDGVYADLNYVSQNNVNNIMRVWRTGNQKPMRYGWLPAHPTFYIKRECYEKYGYFREGLETITMKGITGAEQIKAIMEKLRNNPPAVIGGVKVKEFRDYQSSVAKNLVTSES